MSDKIRIGVIGASGYTGADLVRLGLRHPNIEITALVAKTHAGQSIEQVYPHLGGFGLPDCIAMEDLNLDDIDAVFGGLPHGTAQDIIATLPERIKVIDMSADFRLRDPQLYEATYGRSHDAQELLKTAVYGLTEHYRADIAKSRLVACPGCYPTATLMALLPLVKAQTVDASDLVIDAKSGTTGAGRAPKQNTLFAEAGEGLSPYAIASHRHAPEIEQEVTALNGTAVKVNFTPHLIPMARGELVTCYVRSRNGAEVQDMRHALETAYGDETFIRVLDEGRIPATQHVRGSNMCHINVFEDRIPGRAIVIAAIDNLVKGSAGQALQNFNVMHGLDESIGLEQVALFP